MTPELAILAWSTLLLLVLIFMSAAGNTQTMGLGWGISNRDEASTATGWVPRTRRAYMNLLENLVIFGFFIIIGHLANVHTEMSLLGAEIFLYARLVHAITYVLGITVVGIRTVAYAIGVAGTIMVIWPVIGSLIAASPM
ncbi:MAG: MAPEG family protein [Rhizobiales bacterium]|nr:MAPEG family protein [Hyphomicrobiales bacterium]